MNVAVVILNWNGKDHLSTYLPSVVEHSKSASIIVADNGSTDDSKFVVDQYPAVEWLGLPKNYGFAEGYNQALKSVDADVFVLLNSDVRVSEGWLDAPMSRFEKDDQAAAVQPKIRADLKPSHFEYAGACGGFIDALGYPYCRGRIFDNVEEDLGQYDTPIEVDWATGACCFVRASAWREVGGLDGSFFAHMEEIDLCLRLKRFGYSCWVEPTSTVYHLGGGTLQYTSPRKTLLNFRNSLSTIVKNEPSFIRMKLMIWARLVLDGVAGAQFLIKGQPQACFAIIKAHFQFYARIPSLAKARWDIADKAYAKTNNKSLQRQSPVTSILVRYFLKGQKIFSKLKTP